jgi:hypothetical protein
MILASFCQNSDIFTNGEIECPILVPRGVTLKVCDEAWPRRVKCCARSNARIGNLQRERARLSLEVRVGQTRQARLLGPVCSVSALLPIADLRADIDL